MRFFRWLGLVCLATAAAFLAAGLWSLTFVPVEGEIERVEAVERLASGGYAGVPKIRNAASYFGDLEVEYRYRVGGAEFSGDRIGMGPWPWSLSPLGPMAWERRVAADWPAIVYHSSRWPDIAVLHRGIDPVVVTLLLLVGMALLKFSSWMVAAARKSRPGNGESPDDP